MDCAHQGICRWCFFNQITYCPPLGPHSHSRQQSSTHLNPSQDCRHCRQSHSKILTFFFWQNKGFFKLGKKKDVGRAMQCLTRADSLAAMFERNHWSSLSYSPCRLSYSIRLAKCNFSRMSTPRCCLCSLSFGHVESLYRLFEKSGPRLILLCPSL